MFLRSRPILQVLLSHTPPARPMHYLSLRHLPRVPQPTSNSILPQLLAPPSVEIQPIAGIKHMGVPKLRCRHCYFVIKNEQRFVMCTAKPRHYAAQKMVGLKFGNMILTHATQGSSKWNTGKGSRHMKTQNSFRMEF